MTGTDEALTWEKIEEKLLRMGVALAEFADPATCEPMWQFLEPAVRYEVDDLAIRCAGPVDFNLEYAGVLALLHNRVCFALKYVGWIIAGEVAFMDPPERHCACCSVLVDLWHDHGLACFHRPAEAPEAEPPAPCLIEGEVTGWN